MHCADNNPMPLTRRARDIQPFHVMALLARARALEAQGRSIVHMEIGEPDFETARPIIEAGHAALDAGRTRYTPATGLPELRHAIAGYYARHHDVVVDPERIVVTPGASGALQLVTAVLVEAGQEVLMTDPGYPCNRNFVRLVEGQTRLVPVDATSAYQLTPEKIAERWGGSTIAAMIASPANPTGTLLDREALAALIEAVESRQGMLIVDEIYHGLTYGAAAKTALSISDSVFVINSFSKYFGMTGWRVGWLVAPLDYIPALDRLAQNLFLSAPTPSQWAALAAFDTQTSEILESRRAAFQGRRDYLLPALRSLGFDIPVTPEGAFYLYADCSRFTDDSFGFSGDLLESAGVAITPGIDFGEYRANEHVRFAYTTSMEQLQEGVARIERYLTA